MGRKAVKGYQMILAPGVESPPGTWTEGDPDDEDEKICATALTNDNSAPEIDITCSEFAEFDYGALRRSGTATATVTTELATYMEPKTFFPMSVLRVPPFEYVGEIGIGRTSFQGGGSGGLVYSFDWAFNGPVTKRAIAP